jgi:bifunctional UDP-N-acetylglucosamine pyrophosphorylase / glucosamine-1-phosphate N-acetyltransferase
MGPMSSRPLSVVVLAAGEGKRMRSERPKPLHRLCGRPMALHVIDAFGELDVERIVVVVGHRAEWVTKTLTDQAPSGTRIEFVEQRHQLGTGDAAAVGLSALAVDDDDGDVLIVPGDTPLLRPETLASLVRRHRSADSAVTMLTAELDDPRGYGRVVRDREDRVCGVVEDADADEEQRAIREINTSIYCFRRALLAPSLRRTQPSNAQGEYYLTDVVGVLHDAGYRTQSLVVGDALEVSGVNDRAQLAVAEAELRRRINDRWLRAGVTMLDPFQTYIDATVKLAPDVVLFPSVVLRGDCVVGPGAEIGPGSTLVDTRVGAEAQIVHSYCERATVGARAKVGPFASLGPGSMVEDDAKSPTAR